MGRKHWQASGSGMEGGENHVIHFILLGLNRPMCHFNGISQVSHTEQESCGSPLCHTLTPGRWYLTHFSTFDQFSFLSIILLEDILFAVWRSLRCDTAWYLDYGETEVMERQNNLGTKQELLWVKVRNFQPTRSNHSFCIGFHGRRLVSHWQPFT